jgi:uncharacterized protein
MAALLILASTPAPAQSRAAGDWYGVLETPNGRLTLLVRIQDSANGTHRGEMESDQPGAPKMPLANVVVSAGKLAFSIPMINATYAGDWSEPDQGWTGTFRQGAVLALLLKPGVPPARKTVEGLDGNWRGTLQRNAVTLRLVLRVKTSERGTAVSLDSPDLGALGLEVLQLERAQDTVRFQVPISQVAFRGALDDGRRRLSGIWSRPSQPDAEVVFVRDSAARPPRVRTQMPVIPKGYRLEDVSFANPSDSSVTLGGTVTIPDGAGPFPAAVLISGSGPQDRDETVFGHKPFAVLADHLSRQGILVLRYDDRGVGASTGDHSRATSADFATDANSAVRYLLGRADVDAKAIGLIGHSEGGLIAPIAAVANGRVAYVVLLAGPGINTDALSLSQRRLLGLSRGVSPEDLDRNEPPLRAILAAVRTAADSQQAATRVRELLTTDALRALGVTESQREPIVNEYSGAWMRYFLKYEPKAFLPRLKVPVLAIGGSMDRQVPSAENLAAMRVLFARNRDATVRELPGLNHFFQPTRTGAMGEYPDIPETFAPSAMEVVSDWILARFGKKPA